MRKGDKKQVLKPEEKKHNKMIGVRLDRSEALKLKYLESQLQMTPSKVIRLAIENLFKNTK